MIIASWNVNSVRARMPIVTEWLETARPDVLCLQETKAQDKDFPEEAFLKLGYELAFSGEKSYNGVAIISLHPIKDVRIGFDGDRGNGNGNDNARLIAATIKGVPIVNTYVPQGTHPTSEKFLYKLDWFKRLRQYFDERYTPRRRLVWLGDFNVAPTEIDVHDPKRLYGQVGFHPDEHAALEDVRKWGFVDVFRKHVPDGGQYSFWDYRAKDAVARGKGWRVDHIWATRPLAKKSVRSWIDTAPRLKERPSDHAPIMAEFEVG